MTGTRRLSYHEVLPKIRFLQFSRHQQKSSCASALGHFDLWIGRQTMIYSATISYPANSINKSMQCSGRHRRPSLAPQVCLIGTKRRKCNLPFSETFPMFTQRWILFVTQKCNIREWNDSGSSKPEGHRQEVSKDEVREDVEESEEGEDVGRLHLNNKSHRAGESGGVASGQPSRQQQEQKLKNTKEQNTQISRAGDILASLAPITACMKDPTVMI